MMHLSIIWWSNLVVVSRNTTLGFTNKLGSV